MSVHSQDQPRSGTGHVRQLKYILIAGFGAIAVAAILFVSVLSIRKTDDVLKNKVAGLVSSLNVQMKLNLENYLSRMETIGALAFAGESTYTYDATDKTQDEYEALRTEKEISDQLSSLCIMENFVDYGIVYRNNHFVGKLSNGTISLFGDRLFDDLHAMITQQRTSDGWSAGYQDNFKRLYYVKAIHENALLVISFYTTELAHVFDNPETMADMTIRLTDAEYEIIYSSDENDELGTPLPEDIRSRVQTQNAATVLDNSYLATVSSCGDWFVICSIPTEIILNEKNEMQLYIVLAAIAAAILAVALGIVLSIKLTNVVTNLVAKLDDKAHNDQLTGILNKTSFEDMTAYRLEQALGIEKHALILLDVDNFKGVNDTLGHAYGDQVLAHIGRTLLSVFNSEDFLGRIGGDEFCIFMNISPRKGLKYEDLVAQKCQLLSEAFHQYYTGDDQNYKISCSMGIAMFPQHGRSFEELYAAADKALYQSKRSGKDTYTMYVESSGTGVNAE